MSTNSTFQTVDEKGWRRGFANILRKENRDWWGTRRWWINTLIWLLLINGAAFAALWSTGEGFTNIMTPEQVLNEARIVFTVMAGMFGAVGAIIVIQGTLIDEKKSGTAAWIMSKPASRSAFVIAKLVANIVALSVIIILVQGAVFYVQIGLKSGTAPALIPFLSGMTLLCLHQLFYVSLTLMLGTLFRERGPVIAIPLGVLFSAQLISRFLGSLVYFLPWLILPLGGSGLAVEAMTGEPLTTLTPILATIVWILIFIGVALWRFGREEF